MNDSIRTIGVISGRDGSGKTVVASSVAAILARCGYKTLLVDMDVFSHGSSTYATDEYVPRGGINEKYITITDLFENIGSINNGTTSKKEFAPINELFDNPSINEFTNNNLHIVFRNMPDNIQYSTSPEEIPEAKAKNSKKVIEQITLLAIKKDFKYIIIDTHGPLDGTQIGIILACDAYILVTENYLAKKSRDTKLLDEIEKKQENVTNPIFLGFIINKANNTPTTQGESYQKQYRGVHLATLLYSRSVANHAQKHRFPVIENQKDKFSITLYKLMHDIAVKQDWHHNLVNNLKTLNEEYSSNNKMIYHSFFSRSLLALASILFVHSLIMAYPNNDYNGFPQNISMSLLVLFLSIIIFHYANPNVINRLISSIKNHRYSTRTIWTMKHPHKEKPAGDIYNETPNDIEIGNDTKTNGVETEPTKDKYSTVKNPAPHPARRGQESTRDELHKQEAVEQRKGVWKSNISPPEQRTVAILFAIHEEYHVVKDCFPNLEQDENISRREGIFERDQYSINNCLWEVIVKPVPPRFKDTGFLTTEILTRFEPNLILLLSVTGTLDPNKFTDAMIGDLIVPTEVTVEEYPTDDTIIMESCKPCDNTLEKTRYLSTQVPWQPRPYSIERTESKVHFWNIANDRQSYGFLSAVEYHNKTKQHSTQKVNDLVIQAICNLPRKEVENNRAEYRRQATVNALDFTKKLLEQ